MITRVKIKRDVQKPSPAEHVGEQVPDRAAHLSQGSTLLSKEERPLLRGCLLPAHSLTPYTLLTTFVVVPPHLWGWENLLSTH